MKAKIIAVINPKGGVGKTTTCMCVAFELTCRGKSVLVADCDFQSSSSAWAAAAEKNPFPAPVINLAAFGPKVHRELLRHADDYDYIIVDTPPSLDAKANQSVMCIASLCLIPQQPSPTDLWATRGVRALIEFAKSINPHLKACLLLNRVSRTSLSRAIVAAVGELGIPILQTQMHNRTAYQEAAIRGSAVSKLGRDARLATDEIIRLTDELLLHLEESNG